MADEQPLSDADFMAAKPAQQPLDDQAFMSAKPETPAQVSTPDPVSDAAFHQTTAGQLLRASLGQYTRPVEAAGIAVENAYKDPGQYGLSDSSQQKLADLGVFNDYAKGRETLMGNINEAILKPAAVAADLAMRTLNAGVSGAAALAGGVVNEVEGNLGQGKADPQTVARQAQDVANYIYITAGMNVEGIPAAIEPTMKDVIQKTAEETNLASPVLENASASEKEMATAGSDGKVTAAENSQPALKAPVENPVIDQPSGNLNLKYVDVDKDMQSMLATTAQAYADESGITISHAQTVEEAQKYMDDAIKERADGIPSSLANYNRGDPVNRPILFAARQLTIQATRDALDAVQAAVKTGAPADVQAALAADDYLMTMTGIRHEVTAESGRTLNSAAIPIGEEGANLEKLADKISGLNQEERIRLMATFDSPEAIAKFVRDVKKPTWTDMGIFYVINNYLSGFITHIAYLASWGAQTVIRAGLETPVASAIGRLQRVAGATLAPEEIKALQTEQETITSRLAEADSTQGRPLKAADSVAMQNRLKEVQKKLSDSTTVMPGEAAARFYGIGQGALDSLRAAGRALKTGNIQMLPGEMAAAKQKAKEAVDAALQEGKSAEDAQKLGEAAYNKAAIYSGNPILERANLMKEGNAKQLAQAAGIAVGIPTRVIASIHSLQKFSGYAESLNALAYRQAVSEGLTSAEDIGARIAQLKSDMPPEMIKQAADESKYAALMGKPGAFGQKVEDLAHVNGWTRMVVPFSRVVTNLSSQKFLERTPLGLMSPVIRANLLGANGNAAQATQIAKMLTGTTLMAAGAWLRAQGISTGAAPENQKERAAAYMSGNPPYSVRIGDLMLPHRFFGVPSGSLSLGADVYDIFQEARSENDAWAIFGNTIHVLGNDMLQENALKGAADLFDAIRSNEPDSAKKYVLNAVVAAATPYSVGMSQATRTLDPVMRSTAGKDFWERFKKTEMSHIPWESQSLLPRVDIFGQPMRRGGDYQAMLVDPVFQALKTLDVYPAPVRANVLGVKLDDKQLFDYATKAGGIFYHDMKQQVSDPNWPKYDAETRADIVHTAVKDSREAAKSYMCLAYPQLSEKCAKYARKLTRSDDE